MATSGGGGYHKGLDDQGGGGGDDNQAGTVQNEQGQGPSSYASLVAGKQRKGRKKLNILDVMLERRDNTVNFNLKKDELARLLFKKMKLDPKNILKIDTSGYGKIHIEFKDGVAVDGFTNLPAFDIRDNLRVKYYTPHHRKETLVTISWLDLETPDEMLVHVFNHFGKVKSNVMWSKMKQEESDGELEKLLNNILSGERQLWMEITHPLPSYAMIDKRRVKIHHVGQRRTCARCQKSADDCKGNSNARLCEDNGGVKVNVGVAWKDTLASLNYVDWAGEGVDIEEEEQVHAINDGDETAVEENDISNCDGFVISNLEDNASVEDIKKLMKGAASENVITGITIHPTGSTRSKIVKNVNPALVRNISNSINNKSYRGRLLHCRPHVPVSPPSKKDVNRDLNDKLVNNEKTAAKDLKATQNVDKSQIPGLSQKDIEKARKKADKLKKKEASKEKKNKCDEESKKLSSNMTPRDFLLNSTTNDDRLEGFVFENSSDSEAESFEDTVETQDGEIESTEHVAGTTRGNIKRTSSLADLSPIETAGSKKKPLRRLSSFAEVTRSSVQEIAKNFTEKQ